jgi:tetratricopeptide (TPR) repeat protein
MGDQSVDAPASRARVPGWLCRVLAIALTTVLGQSVCAQDEPPAKPPATTQEPQIDVAAVGRDAATLEQRGEFAAAAVRYRQLMAAAPREPRWLVLAVETMLRAGEIDAAVDLLDEQASAFKDRATVLGVQAKAFHVQADALRNAGQFDGHCALVYEDARRAAVAATALDPSANEARLIEASASFHLGDDDRALRVAEAVVELDPELFGGHAMVGRILFHRFVKLAQELAALDADDPARPTRTDELGELRERADRAFGKAVDRDPNRALPHQRRGDLRAWTGEMEDALEHYATALAIDPNGEVNHDWLRQAVAAEARREFYGEARRRYAARAGATAEGEALLAWYAAQAAFDAKLWKIAAAEFASCAEALPDFVDTLWWLMQSQFWGGEPSAAERTAIQFAQRQPRRFADLIRGDDQTTSMLIGMAAEAFRGRRVSDSRDLNQVIAYAKQTADAWNNYAFLCRETGEFEQSARAYEFALSIEPESPQLLNDAAVILHYHLNTAENLSRAADYYQRAIDFAERDLAGDELTGERLQQTRIALRDARNNLRMLRGVRRR